jgi:small conductance mechanosensitive channel|tara:strand:- start:285 stop:1175 length:891 start_codon:yes stop_codon:yes gene_type:complete
MPEIMNNILDVVAPWLLVHGIKIFFIILVAFAVHKLGGKAVEKTIRMAVPPDDLSPDAERKREDTMIRIFVFGLKITVWSITIVMILPEFGVNIAPILAGAGVLGLAIGFGTQNVVRDFLAGFFVIIENQYRVEDYVCLNDTCGTVEDVTLRKTILRDVHGVTHHITHGTVNRVANYTKKMATARMDISVAYKEDLDHVMVVINNVGKQMAEESPWKENTLTTIQVVGTGPSNFAESGIEITVAGDTKPGTQWGMLREYRKRIRYAFDKEGIEIPFPQRTVWLQKEGAQWPGRQIR